MGFSTHLLASRTSTVFSEAPNLTGILSRDLEVYLSEFVLEPQLRTVWWKMIISSGDPQTQNQWCIRLLSWKSLHRFFVQVFLLMWMRLCLLGNFSERSHGPLGPTFALHSCFWRKGSHSGSGSFERHATNFCFFHLTPFRSACCDVLFTSCFGCCRQQQFSSFYLNVFI